MDYVDEKTEEDCIDIFGFPKVIYRCDDDCFEFYCKFHIETRDICGYGGVKGIRSIFEGITDRRGHSLALSDIITIHGGSANELRLWVCCIEFIACSDDILAYCVNAEDMKTEEIVKINGESLEVLDICRNSENATERIVSILCDLFMAITSGSEFGANLDGKCHVFGCVGIVHHENKSEKQVSVDSSKASLRERYLSVYKHEANLIWTRAELVIICFI